MEVMDDDTHASIPEAVIHLACPPHVLMANGPLTSLVLCVPAPVCGRASRFEVAGGGVPACAHESGRGRGLIRPYRGLVLEAHVRETARPEGDRGREGKG